MPLVVNYKILFPLHLGGEVVVNTAQEIATLIVEEARAQVKAKRLTDRDDRAEFLLGCLALLYWRIRLRIEEDRDDGEAIQALMKRVKGLVCEMTECSEDEFALALVATKDRPRVPYGYTPLQLALARAKKKPLRLLKKSVAGSQLLALIAAVAHHLQEMQEAQAILLPVDDLRELLGLRKLAVSGGVKALTDAGILECVDPTYRTGRARQFKFVGEEGKDYAVAEPDPS